MIIAANMWDDVEDKSLSIRQINDGLQTSLAQLRGIPCCANFRSIWQRFRKII